MMFERIFATTIISSILQVLFRDTVSTQHALHMAGNGEYILKLSVILCVFFFLSKGNHLLKE